MTEPGAPGVKGDCAVDEGSIRSTSPGAAASDRAEATPQQAVAKALCEQCDEFKNCVHRDGSGGFNIQAGCCGSCHEAAAIALKALGIDCDPDWND